MIALEGRKAKQKHNKIKNEIIALGYGFMTSKKCSEVHLWEYYKKGMSLPQK